MARPRTYRICLSDKERKVMRHIRRKTHSLNVQARLAVLLSADENRYDGESMTYADIAHRSGVCTSTVISTLKDYCEEGLVKAITPDRNPNSDTAMLKATGDVEAK